MASLFSYRKFLVIDDFFDFRASLRRMFQTFGATDIDDAPNGEAAVRSIEKKHYDIILCDYNLGFNRKDGQQVLEEIKHRGLIRFSTIFMMITAENSMQMIMGAVEYAPDDYLIKPFSKEVLKNRLEKLLRRKEDFERIERAIQAKEYLRAITLCEDRINENPRNIFEYFRLKADLCITIGDYAEARAVFGKVLEVRDIPWAELGMAKVAFFSEQYEEAKTRFSAIVERNPMLIEAYDWLSRTLIEMKEPEAARDVLLKATAISPKSVRRQQTIGDLSHALSDYPTSERSYKEAIRAGKNSYLKSTGPYMGLARVLVDRKTPDAALAVAQSMRSEFGDSPDAALHAAAVEGIAYAVMGRQEEAKKAIEKTTQLIGTAGPLPVDDMIRLAGICYSLSDARTGTKLMQEVIRNHHDDEETLKKVQAVFTEANRGDEGSRLIAETKTEIVQVNNQGVRLVEAGKIEEAIAYFEKAAAALPGNKIINANAAQAILMFLQQNGREQELLSRARTYLDRVRAIDPAYRKYPKLLSLYERVLAS